MSKSFSSGVGIVVLLAGFGLLVSLALSRTIPVTAALLFPDPLIAPSHGVTLTTTAVSFDWLDAAGATGSLSYTLLITGPSPLTTTLNFTTTESVYTPTQTLTNGLYAWAVQVQDQVSSTVSAPYTFTLEVQEEALVFLPLVVRSPEPECPLISSASFETIPIDGSPTDRPDSLHADLNLSLRGYAETLAAKTLISYSGATDPGAPRLNGLFNPNTFPGITSVYRVNNWNWASPPQPGTPAGPITTWDVTMLGLPTNRGQAISIPERAANIIGDYKVMVLYAEEQRITLGYTRNDTVATGYAVHLEGVCVDPNLLTLYRQQIRSDGYRLTNRLPALRNDQPLGTALGTEIQVVIRDRGSFMDPRSCKDWWSSCSGVSVQRSGKLHITGQDKVQQN
ncbi:MAG TPA: hypothetical protein PKE64_18575 [Anaerolineae bacterium]|nr:hypothetical protein [Anaerolineae bacterium]